MRPALPKNHSKEYTYLLFRMDNDIIYEAKDCINNSDLERLQSLFQQLKTEQYKNIDWQRIFLKVYLHSCLKKQGDIKKWLEEMYETFDLISKIALRQTFPYGNYLFSKK